MSSALRCAIFSNCVDVDSYSAHFGFPVDIATKSKFEPLFTTESGDGCTKHDAIESGIIKERGGGSNFQKLRNSRP